MATAAVGLTRDAGDGVHREEKLKSPFRHRRFTSCKILEASTVHRFCACFDSAGLIRVGPAILDTSQSPGRTTAVRADGTFLSGEY